MLVVHKVNMKNQLEIAQQFIKENFGDQVKSDPGEGESFHYKWMSEPNNTAVQFYQQKETIYWVAYYHSGLKIEENLHLKLLNYLNGWTHNGTFMLLLDKNIGESTISLEQTHFCMYHTYSLEELNHFMFGLYQRIHVYRFSIENLLEKEMSI